MPPVVRYVQIGSFAVPVRIFSDRGIAQEKVKLAKDVEVVNLTTREILSDAEIDSILSGIDLAPALLGQTKTFLNRHPAVNESIDNSIDLSTDEWSIAGLLHSLSISEDSSRTFPEYSLLETTMAPGAREDDDDPDSKVFVPMFNKIHLLGGS